MKEEIKQFLRSIPTIYLTDVFDAMDEVCVERGIDPMISKEHEDLERRYQDLESEYEELMSEVED